MLRTIRNRIIRKVALRHIAGPDINNAMVVCRWADSKGFRSILSPWADIDSNDRPASIVKKNMFERYKLSIDKLNSENLNGYLSIKLNAIDFDYGIFKELLQYGQKYHTRIHVDSLDPDSADTTFRFLEQASDYHDILGCTLPSRWRRSLRDAERAINLNLSIRMVKGQWEDPNRKIDSKKNYILIAEKLAGRAKHIGVATHDVSLAETALKLFTSSATHVELEQFFSLPLNGIDLANKYICPYRLYVAYGHPGIPYNYRFALTRPNLAFWMISDFAFHRKKPWSDYKNRNTMSST